MGVEEEDAPTRPPVYPVTSLVAAPLAFTRAGFRIHWPVEVLAPDAQVTDNSTNEKDLPVRVSPSRATNAAY